MPKFEVHIPAVETTGFNFTFRVDAESWMAALKMGMQKLGEQGIHAGNVLVDIQDDNSLHVTEAESGRVFQIRELTDQEAAAAPVKKTGPRPAARPQPVPDSVPTAPGRGRSPAASEPEIDDSAATIPGAMLPPDFEQRIAAAAASRTEDQRRPPQQLPAEPKTTPASAPEVAAHRPTTKSSPRIQLDPSQVVELERPTRPIPALLGRPRDKSHDKEAEIEGMLADVFERVQGVHAKKTEEEALYFLLDLALEKIPAEAGTVFRADAATGDLSFTAVRGPRAADLLRADIVIPAGTGIVGFCAMEGVTLALSDVLKDPRYDAGVAEKVNFETRSVLCSPMMTHGRTFGCIQILNRKGSATFPEHEVGILTYIAHQAALFLDSRS